MIYFLLPNVNITIYKQIDCQFSQTSPDITISNSLAHYLFEIKNKIKLYGESGIKSPNKIENEWNEYKKYTNPYEFINTIIPGKNKCVAKYKSLSRSYFKMVEILDFLIYHLREPLPSQTMSQDEECFLKSASPIRTFHLAEGPGGFIEATANLRQNPADQYYGMTILDDAENCKIYSLPEIQEKGMNVPGWKKTEAFLRAHPNVLLEHGADGTGNILSLENFLHCREKYGGSMDFITADGGFDFSVDFNNQETNIAALLFAQMCYAICLQKRGGYFVLKIFDCFMDHTVDILYILSGFYEKVYITKPQTSRYANSEKYLVCKNFLVDNDSAVFPFLRDAFQKMLGSPTPSTHSPSPTYITRFLKTPVSIYYIYRLEEYNAIFGQQQIENIYQTMILIDTGNQRFSKGGGGAFSRSTKKSGGDILENKPWSREHIDTIEDYDSGDHMRSVTHHPKLDNLIRTNIQKCIQWCAKYNIAYYSYND